MDHLGIEICVNWHHANILVVALAEFFVWKVSRVVIGKSIHWLFVCWILLVLLVCLICLFVDFVCSIFLQYVYLEGGAGRWYPFSVRSLFVCFVLLVLLLVCWIWLFVDFVCSIFFQYVYLEGGVGLWQLVISIKCPFTVSLLVSFIVVFYVLSGYL